MCLYIAVTCIMGEGYIPKMFFYQVIIFYLYSIYMTVHVHCMYYALNNTVHYKCRGKLSVIVHTSLRAIPYLNCQPLLQLLVFEWRERMQLLWWTLVDGES